MEKIKDFIAKGKKGSSKHSGIIYTLIGALIVVVLLVNLAPTFFSGLGTTGTGLGNATANPAVPSWLPSVLIIIVGAGLVFMLWRVFDGK